MYAILTTQGVGAPQPQIVQGSTLLLVSRAGKKCMFWHWYTITFNSHLLKGQHIPLQQWFSKLIGPQNYLESLKEHRLLSSTLRISDSTGMGQSPRILISNNIPGDTDTNWCGDHAFRTTAFQNHSLIIGHKFVIRGPLFYSGQTVFT